MEVKVVVPWELGHQCFRWGGFGDVRDQDLKCSRMGIVGKALRGGGNFKGGIQREYLGGSSPTKVLNPREGTGLKHEKGMKDHPYNRYSWGRESKGAFSWGGRFNQ